MGKHKKDPHFVYRLKCGDVIVYVGCTKNLNQRMKGHKKKHHNNIEIEKFDYKWTAMSRERDLIIKYLPRYNKIPDHIFENREGYLLHVYDRSNDLK